MVAIGSCDICGEFCADDEDDFATAEYHARLAERLHDCNENHLGPWHDRRGRPRTHCDWCAELAEYYGDDNTLDHTECGRCSAERPLLPRSAPRGWRERMPLRTARPMPLAQDHAHGTAAAADVVRERLTDGLTSTEPVDRQRVTHALRTYTGQRRVRIEWYDSPRRLGARFATAVQAGGFEMPLSQAELEPWSFWPMAPAALRDRVADPYHGPLRGVSARVANELSRRGGAIADAIEDIARPEGSEIWPPFSLAGQFDLVSRRQDLISDLPGVEVIPDGGFLVLMAELGRSAGPVLIFDGAFHVLERPLVLRLDDELRLHSEDGPAVAYPDGSEVWALHGVVVTRDVVLHPERISAADVERERNAEVRRVLVERFGEERLVREGMAELVDEGPQGRLWRWSPASVTGWRRPDPVMMVEVVNSTAEPDGSFRTYFLRVPPDMGTAQQAVAWTFHLEADEYDPARET